MENIRDIKIRIDSIKSTRQITKAMKMVAAANLRKAQNKILKARPYADYIELMLKVIRFKNKESRHPLISEPEIKGKTAFVVVTSDRGLCGSFNYNIIRQAMEYISQNPQADIICIGRKGFDYLKKRTDRIIKSHRDLFNQMDFSVSVEVASFLLDLYLLENYSQINVIYNEYKSVIQQRVVLKQLLPIQPPEDDTIHPLDFIYEPDQDTLIEELGRKYIDVEIWRVMLESSAAEQGARMTAMDSATDNASELIGQLTLKFNRARQASITTEIIEIASGAEAIKS
ncbi:MAG: ATP synthase F1 subunit gamma [Candidatus Cloacimonetes bacterium]|nr:ATP synthase F1 subunit gamma [Candidatus Cloacimonadota bacterium]